MNVLKTSPNFTQNCPTTKIPTWHCRHWWAWPVGSASGSSSTYRQDRYTCVSPHDKKKVPWRHPRKCTGTSAILKNLPLGVVCYVASVFQYLPCVPGLCPGLVSFCSFVGSFCFWIFEKIHLVCLHLCPPWPDLRQSCNVLTVCSVCVVILFIFSCAVVLSLFF